MDGLTKAEHDLREAVKSSPTRILSVDLDGCLAEYNGWKGYTVIGKPRPHVAKMVRQEHAAGTRIIIHTARVTNKSNTILPEALEALRVWLKKYRVPYHEIWLGTGKPYASLYLDDKAHNIDCRECTERWLGQRTSVNERKGFNGKEESR